MAGAPRQLGVVIMVALLAALAVAAVVGSQRRPETLPTWTNGRIAFETGGMMWVADKDGSHPRAIETRSSDKREPSFSPDGSMLAFWSNASADRAYRLFVADPDGAQSVDISDVISRRDFTGPFEPPSWSPDGTSLVVTSLVSGVDALWVVAADGSGAVAITGSDARRTSPVWSPAGDWIAFIRENGAGPRAADFAIVRPDGSDETVLATLEARDLPSGSPTWPTPSFLRSSWSPDGKRIAYQVGPDGSRDIAVVDLAGQGVSVAEGPEDEHNVSWSPTGEYLAYVAGDALVVMRPDGSEARQLTGVVSDRCAGVAGGTGISRATWAPDGTRLVATTLRRECSAVAWFDLVGTPTDPPEISASPVRSLSWQPVGAH